MNTLRKKEVVKQKAKGPTKRFSYDLGSPQPMDKKIEKFLPCLISGRVAKRAEETEGVAVFFALRYIESGWSLCLNLRYCNQRGLNPESTLISFSEGNPEKPTNQKSQHFETRFFAFLSFSTKCPTFFRKDSSNFREYFGGVFLKSTLFILCFLQTLKTKRFWL